MVYQSYLFLIAFFLFGLDLKASELHLKHARGDILLPKVEGWEVKEKVFGMPFILFSPKTNGQRSNISFTHSGLDFPFKVSEIEQSRKEYTNLKQQWSQKVGAVFLGTHDPQKLETLLGHTVHVFAFEYQFKNQHYLEKSYFIKCRGQMIYGKSLRLLVNQAHEENFDHFLHRLNCS